MIKNQWYAILASKEVKNNNPIAVKRLNLNLVLFRDKSGKLSCLRDMCSHRGAQISKGKILDSSHIQCPFHGLEFDKDGKCKFIPALGKNNQKDLSRFNVESYEVREKDEIIYLWYGDKEKIKGEVPFFEENIDRDFVYSEFKDLWNTHYSRSIENQLDIVHLPFVHHNTIGRGNKTLVNGPKIIIEKPDYIMTSANNEKDFGQIPKGPDECEIRSTYLKFKFPNIWMNHVSQKIAIIIFFAPIDDEKNVLYIRFYNKITKSKIINRIIAFFGKLANLVIERQDKRVVVTQRPKRSSLKMKENLIPGDRPIIEYRKIRDELIKENKES